MKNKFEILRCSICTGAFHSTGFLELNTAFDKKKDKDVKLSKLAYRLRCFSCSIDNYSLNYICCYLSTLKERFALVEFIIEKNKILARNKND